nr:MAG TPA: hypothetical protein [Caudoviricetes sp.]
MEKMNEVPRLKSMTLHFSDGSHRVVDKGLFAHTMPSGGVEAMCLDITPIDYLAILAALEEAMGKVLIEAE